MRTQDLAILAGIGIVGFGLFRGGFFKGFGQVGAGVGEAVSGAGAGVSEAVRGVGAGIAQTSQAVGMTLQDVLGITALMRPIGAVGAAGAGEVERWVEGREREAGQEAEIDIIAFEKEKEELARIQADIERKQAEEKAERKRLITEEKTQYVEFATTLPERVVSFLRKGWSYTPMGLLQNYIQGQVSIEEEAAPQQSILAPTISEGAVITSEVSTIPTTPKTEAIRSTGGGTYATAAEAAAVSESGTGFAKTTTGAYIPLPTIKLEPKPTIREKIGSWFRRLTFRG